MALNGRPVARDPPETYWSFGHRLHSGSELTMGLPIPLVALGWAFVSAASLPLGAIVAISIHHEIPEVVIGQMMAFGAGALLFAVSVEMFAKALTEVHEEDGKTLMSITVLMSVVGALVYIILNRILSGSSHGGSHTTHARTNMKQRLIDAAHNAAEVVANEAHHASDALHGRPTLHGAGKPLVGSLDTLQGLGVQKNPLDEVDDNDEEASPGPAPVPLSEMSAGDEVRILKTGSYRGVVATLVDTTNHDVGMAKVRRPASRDLVYVSLNRPNRR